MFETISMNDLTEKEKRRATESLVFLIKKLSGKIKVRTVSNGSTQGSYINRDDKASPRAASDAIIVTGVI